MIIRFTIPRLLKVNKKKSCGCMNKVLKQELPSRNLAEKTE
jgi:hypothetical protein